MSASAGAARAAEVLAQLAAPPRLAAFAELVRRGKEGATLAELAYALDVPVQQAGESCARLTAAGLATGTGNGIYRADLDAVRQAVVAVDRMQPITPLLAEYPHLRGFFAHGRLTALPPTMSDRYQQIGELFARFLALAPVSKWETGCGVAQPPSGRTPRTPEYNPGIRAPAAHAQTTPGPRLAPAPTSTQALDGLCDEDEINRRLSAVTDDAPSVRRMLVDTGWLERDSAGTTYGSARPLPAMTSSATQRTTPGG